MLPIYRISTSHNATAIFAAVPFGNPLCRPLQWLLPVSPAEHWVSTSFGYCWYCSLGNSAGRRHWRASNWLVQMSSALFFLFYDPLTCFSFITSPKLECTFSSIFYARFWSGDSDSGCRRMHIIYPGHRCKSFCNVSNILLDRLHGILSLQVSSAKYMMTYHWRSREAGKQRKGH